MEWDWWSRMQGSSSVPKTPRQGKWWANLRDPVWPRRNSRWQRHWPRSFGVLPVDLNSVHVKTLDEILREREAKKCREQAMSLAPASHSFQEMTRNLQMAHHQEKNPISRVRWSQFNFHGEERNDDEDDGEDVVAMDMAESDHSEEDNAEAEFSSDELCPEEREGDLSEETSTSSLEEEDGNKIDPVEGDIIPEEWEDRDSDKVVQLDDPRVNVGEDQSCLEEGEEEIELLKFSLGDFWPEESNRSVDGEQDERFPEGVGESTRSGQESDNKEEAEMQDGLQADVADNQSICEENDGDNGDVVSSQDESHLGELDSGVDGETVCSPQQEEYEIHDEARNVKGDGETVEQSNLEEDAGDFEKCKKGDNQDMEDLASSLDVLCPEEASGDVCEVTSGSLQYEECQIDQSDERIICSDQGSNNGNALKQSDPQEDLGRENIAGDESYHEEKDKNTKVYVPPDDFCPEETQDCRTAQVWKVILDVVKGDKHYDRKTVQQGDLLFDTGDDKDHPQENTEDTDCAEDDICLTQSTSGVDKDISDIHQEEEELKLVPVEESSLSGQGMWNDKGSTLWENGRVDACVSKSFQVAGEENMEVNATDKRGEGYQSVEESSVDTSMEEGKGKSEISEEAPDEGSYEGVSAGDTSSSEGTDREEEQDIRGKGCQGDESPKGGEDNGCLDKSTKEVKASSLDLSQDSYRKKDTDNQSPRTSPSIGQMVDECSGTDVLTDSEETSDTSTTANKPVCAQVEEADKAAVKRKKDVCLPELKELVNAPRALQDEMSYLPTEFSHPVVSNKSETKSRPQTRKRKCEESTAGGVTFLKVRGKRDGLRKTRQESAGQRQARSGKVERLAKVKNKLTSKDASTSDIPEVPQTRPQRQVAVTEGPQRKRGRFCRKPREGGEVIRKLGQAKEMGPGAELGLSRTGNERHDRPRRKAKDGKGKEDPSQKEPARRLKRSRARDDVSVSEGKKLQGSVEQCGQLQEVSDNSRQSQNSRKRARKAEDDILRKVKRPKRNKNDGVSNKNHEGDDTLPPASPKSASGGVKTRSNFSDPGTVMHKKRGPKAKLQSVNPAQPSSNTVAEKAPVLHVAVTSDKIEPKENTSTRVAQERQDTERNVLETTDFECAKKPKGRRDNCASNNYDRRDTCNPLLKPSPGNTSEGVTTRSNSTTGTLVLKKRGRKPKIQPVNLLQRSSNMVAEVLPILHKVVAGDKIKPRECLSVWAAEEGQSTSREVPESPDFEGAKKSKGQRMIVLLIVVTKGTIPW
ncbi:uncharacterized protein LOC110983350 isoform X2 [Acanthaster planci]|uniref:Uncharacterized protein LOC110983350 isoform X2 n=1 Tax=Acanthaster planci TaxID=133434 RepID=A0A8B7YY17_ACAPL|nr:uncharacterized protein LOC110983350 isoform X2 [Acanthaster planci]